MDYHRQQVARIRSYLEEHRHAYDRDALRRKLIADGHDPDMVDEAIAQVYAQNQETDAPEPLRMVRVVFFVVLINSVVLCQFAQISRSLQLFGSMPGTAGSRRIAELYPQVYSVLWILLGVMIVELVIGVVMTYGRIPGIRQARVLPGIAGGILLSVALTLLAFGICIYPYVS